MGTTRSNLKLVALRIEDFLRLMLKKEFLDQTAWTAWIEQM